MSDLGVIYAALKTALTAGTASWGTRAYADQAPASTPNNPVVRPYVVYGYSAGGDANQMVRADPNILIDVIAVADKNAQALTADTEIRALLDDQGFLEGHTINGDSEYIIKTITREMRVHLVENVSGASQIYHSGAKYRFIMEKR